MKKGGGSWREGEKGKGPGLCKPGRQEIEAQQVMATINQEGKSPNGEISNSVKKSWRREMQLGKVTAPRS